MKIYFSPIHRVVCVFLLFIAMLIVFRIWYSNTLVYGFLVWNLFLAWIPFVCSEWLIIQPKLPKWNLAIVSAIWLLFFPNSLYLITDLIHLDDHSESAPVWFDALLLFVSGITGLLMDFVSWIRMESILLQRLQHHWAKRLSFVFLLMGAFGVYLGRFLRLNSWDILTQPQLLAKGMLMPIVFPFDHGKAWAITGLFSALFVLLFYSLKKMPKLLNNPGSENDLK